MRNSFVPLSLLTALFVALPAVLLAAQEPAHARRITHAPRYDAAKEVTLEGTVECLVTKPAPGKMLGGHLIVSTAKGSVDGQIGACVLRGSRAFTATPGEKVKITGVMTTFHGQEAFLVRTIETPDRTVVVRDAHGYFDLVGQVNSDGTSTFTGLADYNDILNTGLNPGITVSATYLADGANPGRTTSVVTLAGSIVDHVTLYQASSSLLLHVDVDSTAEALGTVGLGVLEQQQLPQ